jgi:hypothetical protein
MALEVQVYKDIRAYEPKVLFGMSWRQIGAVASGAVVGGVIYAAVAVVFHSTGSSWSAATNWAVYVTFPLLMPFAAWGWWRPKGLKPERYIGYVINHQFSRKVITYADEYRGMESGGATDQRGGKERKDARKKEKAALEGH